MTLQRSKVLQQRRPSREAFGKAIAEDWHRAFPVQVRGGAAEIMGCSKKTIGNAVGQVHQPDSYTLVMSLLADPTALQATLATVGLKVSPLVAEPANDLQAISNLSQLAARWAEALADGIRDHRETCDLASMIIAQIPALMAIVAEAGAVRTG